MTPAPTPLRVGNGAEPPRVMPVQEEAEQALLGAILIDNRALDRVPWLRPEHFSRGVHQRIFAAIGTLVERGAHPMPVTLKIQFDQDTDLAPVGGSKYLFQLADTAVTIHNAEDYGRAILDAYKRRQLIALADDVRDDAYACDLARPADEIAAAFKSRLSTIAIGEQATELKCTAAAPHQIADIPPRRWAYGNFLLFGAAGVIGAIDGGGKGAMAVTIALANVTGQPLLGERVWRTGPVVILTYEDDETEWRRRIAAACLHYKIDYQDVIGSFYFISHPQRSIILAARGPSGIVLLPDGDNIIRALKSIGAVLFIVDPFNHAHELDDGNNNVLIARVACEVGRIARQTDAAALVLHHLRKGSTGDPDDLMGATALRATFRGCRILHRMTAEEAKRIKVPERQAWRYSRISGSKENYAPPPETAKWYRFESIALGNPNDLYTEGDNVQVTTTWTPPSAFEGISLTEIAEIFAKLRIMPGPGLRWSPDRRAKEEWVGSPIAEVTGNPDDEIPRIITAWIETNVLTEDKYDHPKQRKPRRFVTLNETKAAEILEPFRYGPEPE
jgi:hypothetical protein